jgi:hypothetical protein
MAANLLKALDQRIGELQSQLSALQTARAALAGSAGRGPTAADGRRRRTFTAAQRAEISRRMKATWAKRRKDSGKN